MFVYGIAKIKDFSLNLKTTKMTFIIALILLVSANALAVSTNTISTTVSNYYRYINSDLKGSVSFQANQFSSDIGQVQGNRFFGDLELDYNGTTESNFNNIFKLAARYNDSNQLMYSIEEMKFAYKFGSSKVAVGRMILNWGELDQNWGLGKINNRKNFDSFEPGQEGLTGFLYEKHADNGFKVSSFLSILYAPELNPGMNYDNDKGSVQCLNPWCKAPASSAPIEDGIETPIFYNVNEPEISDVVFRYTAGLRLGYETEKFSVSSFALRKPENQISLTAEVQYEIDNGRAFADITPQFYYHDVIGADINVRPFSNVMLYASILSVSPSKFPDGDVPYIEYTGIKPEKRNEDYVGTGIIFDDGEIKTGVNYIARISDFDKNNDILAEYPRWNQAWHTYVNAHITRKLSLGFDLKYDMLTDDRLSMYRVNYELRPNTIFSAGVNIIGTGKSESYWKDFTNNDSVFSSLKYTF